MTDQTPRNRLEQSIAGLERQLAQNAEAIKILSLAIDDLIYAGDLDDLIETRRALGRELHSLRRELGVLDRAHGH